MIKTSITITCLKRLVIYLIGTTFFLLTEVDSCSTVITDPINITELKENYTHELTLPILQYSFELHKMYKAFYSYTFGLYYRFEIKVKIPVYNIIF